MVNPNPFRLGPDEQIVSGATPMRCPSGNIHTFTYTRDAATGVGLYECNCGTTLEKRSLKRLTDHVFDPMRNTKAP